MKSIDLGIAFNFQNELLFKYEKIIEKLWNIERLL